MGTEKVGSNPYTATRVALLDDDLNAVADRLDEVVSEQIVGKTWANA